MGKATRIKQRSARERIAAQREAERRAEARRRLLITGGSVLAVIVIVVAFIVVKSLGSPPAVKAGGPTRTPLPAAVVKDITNVPASTLATVGKGSTVPRSIIPLNGSPLTSGGKPEVLYIGAEYCPYCAAERWAMAVALSRFGTFSGLHGIHSAGAPELFPNTPTLTFYKSSYSSRYLVFTPVETSTENRSTVLQKPTAAQQALLGKYDAPPYVAQASAGAIPFIDLGNKYLISGASYSPQVLAGKTWGEVASALSDPATPVSQGAVGAANMMTAALCKLTNNQPASACTPAVQRLEGQLR